MKTVLAAHTGFNDVAQLIAGIRVVGGGLGHDGQGFGHQVMLDRFQQELARFEMTVQCHAADARAFGQLGKGCLGVVGQAGYGCLDDAFRRCRQGTPPTFDALMYHVLH